MKTEKKPLERKIISPMVNLRTWGITLILVFAMLGQSCQKKDMVTPVSSDQTSAELKLTPNNVDKINLVADVEEEYNPVFIDESLVNAWGMAFDDEGEIWVSSAEKGLSTIYNADGETLKPPVNIPFGGDMNGGAPTGVVYNTTSVFVIPATNEESEFIFATENGTIAAWSSGPSAITVADRSDFDAVYKGVAFAKNGGEFFLYATNFKGATVDVFNSEFEFVSNDDFIDPDIPAGYAPFNIVSIHGLLFVSYAKQLAPDNVDDEAGAGHGYVDIFNPDGSFVKRFASEGSLNSPWGMAEVSGEAQMLIGNFGDGKINIFDTANGEFIGYLKSENEDVEVEGLWAIAFPHKNLAPGERKRLYFTAGPDEEEHGVFGYLFPSE